MGRGSEAYASRLSLFSNKFDIGVRIIITVKAPVTHSRFWLRLITIRPDETYVVKSGCIGMVKTENSEIPTMSHDVPTVSLRLLYDS